MTHSSMLRIMLLLAGIGSATGCTTFGTYSPGATFGEIKVIFPPRITNRERLLNDRLEQDIWLTKRLAEVQDSDITIDGSTDLRNLSIISSQTKANIDPTYQVYAEQAANVIKAIRSSGALQDSAQQITLSAVQQISAKVSKGELTYDQAKTQLTTMGITLPDPSNASPNSPPTFAASSAVKGDLQVSTAVPALLKSDSSAVTPPATSSAKAAIQLSAIDRFHDLVAIREEIRTARIDNALDETHDQGGYDLIRLTFDATTIPQSDTSATAVVELTMRPAPAFDKKIVDDFRLAIEEDIESRVEQRAKLIVQRMEVECSNALNLATAIQCAWSDIPGRERDLVWAQMNLFNIDKQPFNLLKAGTQPVIPMDTVINLKRILIAAEIKKSEDSAVDCFVTVQHEATGVSVVLRGSPPQGKYCTNYANPEERQAALAGYMNFSQATIRSYAVTPSETVQRLSELGSNRTAKELVLGLAAALPGGGASTAMQGITANDALYQAIRRQPLVVGYGEISSNKESRVGWLLGPAFRLSADGKKVSFRHSVKQQALTAMLSVPSWMTSMPVCVRTFWIKEDGTRYAPSPIQAQEKTATGTRTEGSLGSKTIETLANKAGLVTKDALLTVRNKQTEVADSKLLTTDSDWCADGKAVSISLPNKGASLLAAFNQGTGVGGPVVSEVQDIILEEGSRAELLITGDHLWRGTEVYIGGQKADRISLTPNMRGVQAVFEHVSAPRGSVVKSGKVDLTIFTSNGKAHFGTAKVLGATDALSPLIVVAAAPRVIVSEPYAFEFGFPLQNFSSVTAFLTDPDAQGAATIPVAIQLAEDGRRASVKFPEHTAYKHGIVVNVNVSVVDAPNRPPRNAVIRKGVRYFSKEPVVSASVIGKANQLKTEILLKFESALLLSYPELKLKPVFVNSYVMLDNRYDLQPTLCKIANEVCTIQLPIPDQVIKSAQEAKKFTVNIDLSGSDVPKVTPVVISID